MGRCRGNRRRSLHLNKNTAPEEWSKADTVWTEASLNGETILECTLKVGVVGFFLCVCFLHLDK